MFLTISILVTMIWIFAWYFVGYYHIDDIEDEAQNVYFIKKIPVYKIQFINVSKMEVWQREAYPNQGLGKLAEYCHHRYGVKGTQTEILKQCGKIENIRLPTN